MKRFTLSELKLKFSEICKAIENGEEVIIEKREQPFAKLTKYKFFTDIKPEIRNSDIISTKFKS